MSYPSSGNRPQSFPGIKGPDPLSGSLGYDSAIDLFSMNNIPDTFMDLPPASFEPNYFSDPFAAADIGFAISNNSTEDMVSYQSPSVSYMTTVYHPTQTHISQDLDSDDQMWSPTCPTGSVEPAMPTSTGEQTPEVQACFSPAQCKRESVSTQSSEEHPERSPSPQPSKRMSRTRPKDLTQPHARNAAKRAAHNVIEKRYRTNMNAKFVALEKATSGGVQKTKRESGSLKKSEILANAIAYVQRMQEENKALQKEVSLLRQDPQNPRGWRPKRGEMFRG